MKKLSLFLIFLFLVACAPQFESTQKVTEKPADTTAVKTNTTNITKSVIPKINNALPKNKMITKIIGGQTHIIEVVDVTSDGSGCLLKVDGIPTLIDEGETATVNGLKIFVLEVRALRDTLQQNDLCEILVT